MKRLLISILFLITAVFASSKTVTLIQKGDFSQYSYFGFFIDSDNNSKTGYCKGTEVQGADFLVQENGLYRYPKGASGWQWERVSKDVTVTHTNSMMRSEIPLSLLQVKSETINYNASLSTLQWKKSVILQRESMHVPISIKKYDYTFILKGSLLYSPSHVALYIDADHNPKSGYTKNGIVGADILIQNKEVYIRKNPDYGKWSDWQKVGESRFDQYDYLEMSVSFDEDALHGLTIDSQSIFQAFSYSQDYSSKKTLLVSSKLMPKSDFISISKNSYGVKIESIKSAGQNLLRDGSKLFELTIKELSSGRENRIDSLSGWGNVVLDSRSTQIKAIFSNPQNSHLPKALKVIATIKLNEEKSTWDITVDGVGKSHSVVDIVAPKLRFKLFSGGKFLIPKYTGKIIDVETEEISRNMLYPSGWQSTMQFLAYYNDKVGIYLGNHDPKASIKRFIIQKKDGVIEYSTNIIPPNKTVANNNFRQSGVFELDSFRGDWFDASKIYKKWASKEAEYWPKMTANRIKRQHKLGEVAVWASCIYISAIEGSSRSQESKDAHIANYLVNIENILENFAAKMPNVGLGIFWHEWYGELHDTNFPSVFFPTEERNSKIKQMMANVKQRYPQVQFMPYINGLLYNVNLPDFVEKFALKQANGDLVMYYPRGEQDRGIPEREFARMDPTQAYWQDTIKRAADEVLNKIDADALHVDQVTASRAIEDMDPSHNHPLAGGYWWRDGYNEMFAKIDSVAKGSQYVTSEGASEFISKHVDGFFIHWSGVDKMVAAYQAVYSGRVQLFGLQMNTRYEKSFYMQYAQAFTHGIQLGIITPYLTEDPKERAVNAFHFVKNLAIMRYKLREFLSYGEMQKEVPLRGDIPILSTTISDAQAGVEPDGKDGTIEIRMPAIQHSVYKNEAKDKVAFIFTNAAVNENVAFSFDIDPSSYGFGKSVKLTKMDYSSSTKGENIKGKITKDVTLKPLESVVYVISR